MAITIPDTIPRKATAGERLLFDTLRKYLPDDYILYYEPDIYGKKPDFLIIAPTLGFIILEVKDYTKSSLVYINSNEWTLFTSKQEQITVVSPLIQARNYAFSVEKLLLTNSNLVREEGPYRGRLLFPYGYGAVLTRLQETDLVAHDLFSVIPSHQCLTRGEIDPDNEAFSEENLINKINNMFVTRFQFPALSDIHLDAIRGTLFPEVRISAKCSGQSIEPSFNQNMLLKLSDMKAMDLYQEKLARQVGEGHRLIRGVAGSGKTLVLTTHAKLLAKQNPTWKILVLCFNISLARFIKNMIEHSDIEVAKQTGLFDIFDLDDITPELGRIEVLHFHDWLTKLKIREDEISGYLDGSKKQEIVLPQYDAILIDEGQDCDAEWIQLAIKALNPETKAFLLVEDRAQSIYKRKRTYIQDIGLDFRGRSRVLKINYRNTQSVVEFAWKFYRAFSELRDPYEAKKIDPEEIIVPQATMRIGKEPKLIRCDSFEGEVCELIDTIKRLKGKGVKYKEMLVLYRVKGAYENNQWKNYLELLNEAFLKEGIPYYWVAKDRDSKINVDYNDDSIKVSTIDSSKGLDFKTVFIIGAHNMPFYKEEDSYREASLLYIGMTRARDDLYISYSGTSEYTQYFDKFLD